MIVALDVEPLTIARYLTHIYFGSNLIALSIGPVPRIKPATSHSKVKRSNNWANLAEVQEDFSQISQVYLTFQQKYRS